MGSRAGTAALGAALRGAARTAPSSRRSLTGGDLKTSELVETILTPEGALTRPVELRPRKVDLKKRLERAEADVKAGRVRGPFTSASAVTRALRRERRARARR